MFDSFQQQLTDHHFTASEIEQMMQSARLIELPTRHILLNQGDIAREICFILQGICHAVYLTGQGKAFSKEFWWENDWIIGFESLIRQQPSPYLIESLTPCTLVTLPIETLWRWREQKHGIYLKLLETQLIHKEHKERFMLLYSPQERYQLFREHFPDLLERLSDYQIAAYLGITPVSLSRIKKRCKN
ncbi:Crp/Fnr family transcriptional regulator [Vibrio quintilis]|nr:Crp/Fnr family transcriptional regulator [Vibrio quintilis]